MVSLSCTPEYAVTGADAGRLTVNMRVLAPYLPDEGKRAPVSLSCVLDKSVPTISTLFTASSSSP